MSILFGTSNVSEIFLGTSSVSKIYLGTDLVWEKNAGQWVLFDSGYVDGVTWEVNGMTRPKYTDYGGGSLSYVEERGEMLVTISKSGAGATTTYYHYGLLNTSSKFKIPKGATTFNVKIRKEDSTGISANVGLVLPTASNSIDTTNGGVMSGNKTVSNTTYQTITVPLAAGMAGSEDYVAVIHSYGQSSANRWAWIGKVWFE